VEPPFIDPRAGSILGKKKGVQEDGASQTDSNGRGSSILGTADSPRYHMSIFRFTKTLLNIQVHFSFGLSLSSIINWHCLYQSERSLT